MAKNKQRRVYGRRQGRPLNQERTEALDTLLPDLSIKDALLSENSELDPSQIFSKTYKDYWFEIGFGSGEHLKSLMIKNPETGYLGAEPFINGMSAFLKSISDLPEKNIRLLMDDAMMIANSLKDECLGGIYILNPDPWHKTRHHKRRIVSEKNLVEFARILKPGGKLILSTDVTDLADWMIIKTITNGNFEWTAKSANDWRTPPSDWISTRYETKGAKGASKMCYLLFTKKLA